MSPGGPPAGRRGVRARLPGWTQTIRFRLTVAYSAVLFALVSLALGGVYLALSANVEAAPLKPVTVNKVYKDAQGDWQVKEGHQFEAADIRGVEAAVNHTLLERLRDYSMAGAGGLFVVSLGTGWWLSGRVLRPVRRITGTAQEISATDLSRRIALDGPKDELRALADTVDAMLGRLEGAFAAQRQMVDEASHELRNPLAVIQANVDAVLIHEDTSPEARAQAGAIVTRATSRMTHLVEDLLASARRSSPAFADVDADLAAIGDEAAEEYAALAAEHRLTLTRRLASGPVVAGDPRALRRAVDNLLSNAVRLAPGGSELLLAAGSQAGWAWIALRDEGPGIAVEDRERVFDRFVRSGGPERADAGPRTEGQRRVGLGLAIVRQIAESHGGSAAVHSDLGAGSTFVLWLPDRAFADTDRRAPFPPAHNPLGRAVTAG
ncbi:signal transduction histidine kinase [Murinocardiopsis flavida]|uniref:histidine kinase n=1 Tax=Murinocardiopsis flavida TaxID=645275 RepID=A0A2P8DMP7_9ACTN|nr:HAMP domain-containing sensor histidine kinase [Murinocardiopsis flavida]PSK98478.1 signal transduction histidine kinase [Murinocardiopsis flavida]